MRNRNQTQKIKKITAIGMFCALSYVCLYFIKIPVQFLTLDVKDSLITLCALLFGPLAGAAIAFIVPLLEFITISDTGIYGFIMNALSSVTFSVTAGLIYRYKKTMTGAIVGLVSGVCAVTAVMLLANLCITPYYMHAPVETVAAMIPTVLLPFNLVKAILNAAIVLLLYKPLSNILKKIGFLQATGSVAASESARPSRLRSLLITLIAAGVIAVSLAVILLVLR
ncbi:MAG: ECF transporter S component [Ruminococcaceae bacterium]|nr:ECF transporter S component [Oscillospiraceae bacterium]